MRLQVCHKTEYQYPGPVSKNRNELRLRPREGRWQVCESSLISVLPAARLSHYKDLNGNVVHFFTIEEEHTWLTVNSKAVVLTKNPVDYNNLPYGFSHAKLGKCRLIEECHPFLQNSTYVEVTPEVWRQALDIMGDSTDVFQTSYAIMEYIFHTFQYQSGATTVSTAAGDVLLGGKGVCQDFAHVMVALCRSLSIPARYVSGYFFDPTGDHRLRGSGASHAWAEIYIDGKGWIGLDPTNNKVVDETYVILAIGRDYRDVAPVMGGYFGPSRSWMNVTVRVERLD